MIDSIKLVIIILSAPARMLMAQLRLCFLQKLSNLRATVGGGKDEGITSPMANGVRNTSYSSNLVPADSNSLVFARTPTEASATSDPCLKTMYQVCVVNNGRGMPLMFNGETSQIACACLEDGRRPDDATLVATSVLRLLNSSRPGHESRTRYD